MFCNKYNFIFRSKRIHGNKYDYSHLTEEECKAVQNIISIFCVECDDFFKQSIQSHLRGAGCSRCAGNEKWYLGKFLKAVETKQHLFDYSAVKEEHIINVQSKVPIGCKICNYKFHQTIGGHVNGGYGCPNCADNIPWTLPRFLEQTKHRAKYYDYSKITDEDFTDGGKSKLTIGCKKCDGYFTQRLDHHVGGGNCSCYVKWYYEKLIERSKELYGDLFDYSLIDQSMKITTRTSFKLGCRKCRHIFTTCINNHIYKLQGCKMCKKSSGEQLCMNILREMNIHFEDEYTFNDRDYRFDFYFNYNGTEYILEYDCSQHFIFNTKMFKNYEEFLERRETDVIKSQIVLDNNINLIRIDCWSKKNIKEHLLKALELNEPYYFSNNELYKWILDEIETV